MLVILMRSETKVTREKNQRHTLARHLKTCLPQDVLAGQRKRTRATILSTWWMGLADRSLLSPSLLFTLFPSIRSSSSSCFSLPPTQSHNLFLPTGSPETDFTRWQIYRCRHEVKRLKLLVTPEVLLLGRWDWSAIYICWGPSKGHLLYISTTGDSVCISQKIALTTLSSWKARIFSFLKTYLDFFLDVSSLLDKWVYEPYVWDFPLGSGGGKAGSHFHSGQHTYRLMSGSWLEVCSDGAHRCSNPTPTLPICHKTTSYGVHN